jgi:hypothetical protein
MQAVSRGAIFWGLALITGGLVVLALQQDWISGELLADIGRFWPVLLIGAGVALIFAGTLGVVATALAGIFLGALVGALIGGVALGPVSVGCGTGDPGPLAPFEDGTFSGDGAQVRLELNCTALEVVGGDSDSDWSVEADADAAEDIDLSADGDSLAVRTDETVVVGLDSPRAIEVTIPRSVETALELQFNAGDATVDLADGTWGALDLDGNAMSMLVDLSGAEADAFGVAVNAGSAEIAFSESTRIGSVTLGVNAGSIEVCAPDGLGLAFTIGAEIAASHNLDDAGLVESGNVWRTPDYETADNQVDITFTGNAASLTLNPEGGCS